MGFREDFPIIAWIWRRISSRWACRIYLLCLAIILIPAVIFRMDGALFERRAHKLMVGLSSLRIGATSKAEALSQIPGLAAIHRADKEFNCPADECFSVGISNSRISDWALLPVCRAGHAILCRLLNRWGLQYWNLEVDVDFTAGKVTHLNYLLILSTLHAYPYPGALTVGASSRTQIADGRLDWDFDESPDYRVYHYFKWPELNTGVYFTRDAPIDLVNHAFDIHLRCVWFLTGCQNANQLLPDAERDRQKIRQAALDRMRGSDQCPARILRHRARDVQDILLVEVKSVSPAPVTSERGTYEVASFRLLRILKGKANRPLDNVDVTRGIVFGERLESVHNSSIELLNPGQRILLFSGASLDIDEPCEAMSGSDDAVLLIEKALSSNP